MLQRLECCVADLNYGIGESLILLAAESQGQEIEKKSNTARHILAIASGTIRTSMLDTVPSVLGGGSLYCPILGNDEKKQRNGELEKTYSANPIVKS